MTTNTLSVGGTVLALPDDLDWADEYSWSAVEQSTERSLSGALIVEASAKTGGRSITLQSPDPQSGWITGAQLTQLRAWANVPLQEMQLTYRGQTYPVMFRHQDGPLEAAAVAWYSDPLPSDFFTLTMRLMDVTP